MMEKFWAALLPFGAGSLELSSLSLYSHYRVPSFPISHITVFKKKSECRNVCKLYDQVL